jgi:hypothetical protein
LRIGIPGVGDQPHHITDTAFVIAVAFDEVRDDRLDDFQTADSLPIVAHFLAHTAGVVYRHHHGHPFSGEIFNFSPFTRPCHGNYQ